MQNQVRYSSLVLEIHYNTYFYKNARLFELAFSRRRKCNSLFPSLCFQVQLLSSVSFLSYIYFFVYNKELFFELIFSGFYLVFIKHRCKYHWVQSIILGVPNIKNNIMFWYDKVIFSWLPTMLWNLTLIVLNHTIVPLWFNPEKFNKN